MGSIGMLFQWCLLFLWLVYDVVIFQGRLCMIGMAYGRSELCVLDCVWSGQIYVLMGLFIGLGGTLALLIIPPTEFGCRGGANRAINSIVPKPDRRDQSYGRGHSPLNIKHHTVNIRLPVNYTQKGWIYRLHQGRAHGHCCSDRELAHWYWIWPSDYSWYYSRGICLWLYLTYSQ